MKYFYNEYFYLLIAYIFTIWFIARSENFFLRTKSLVTEYKNIKLKILNNYNDIYTKEEWKKLIVMFKSEKKILEYLKITEENLDVIVKRKNENEVINFKNTNEKEETFFSMDYLIKITKLEAYKFNKFLQKLALKYPDKNSEFMNYNLSDYISANISFNINQIKKKKKKLINLTRKDILESRMKKLLEAKENKDIKYIEDELRKKLIIWFKFFFARMILQRYTNIPSGLLVVKIADYSMRMITEVVYDVKTVNITRGQNDGTSESFEGDGLVNLFLYTWNTYLHGRKEKVLEQIEFNINTISDNADEEDEMIIKLNENMHKEIKDWKELNS